MGGADIRALPAGASVVHPPRSAVTPACRVARRRRSSTRPREGATMRESMNTTGDDGVGGTSAPADPPFRVLIAGGGVAGLEALLALRDLASDRVAVTLVSAEREFSYRPMAVAEPFARGHAQRKELAEIAASCGAEF